MDQRAQRKHMGMRYLLWDRAQIEKGGNGRAIQQKDGDLQRMQQESPTKEQAMRIVSVRRVESSLQSDSNLGTVVGARGGAVASIPSNEGRITQAALNVRSQRRALGRLSPAGSSEASQSHQTLVVGM